MVISRRPPAPRERHPIVTARFHWRHTDLMDVLSGYQPRAAAALDEIAMLLGFPGKLGMAGDKVWQSYQKGELRQIRDYCDTDVLNTYLVYLRFELIRGRLTEPDYLEEVGKVRHFLDTSEAEHFGDFLRAWDLAEGPLSQGAGRRAD